MNLTRSSTRSLLTNVDGRVPIGVLLHEPSSGFHHVVAPIPSIIGQILVHKSMVFESIFVPLRIKVHEANLHRRPGGQLPNMVENIWIMRRWDPMKEDRDVFKGLVIFKDMCKVTGRFT